MSAKINLDAGLNASNAAPSADVENPLRRMKHTVGGVDHYLTYNLYTTNGK